MAIAIAQSESRSVTAQDADPTATPTPLLEIIEPEPTETPLPKREAEQEYAAGADCSSGGETGDSSGCSGARGRPQWYPTSTPRPTATATPKPKPTATPQPPRRDYGDGTDDDGNFADRGPRKPPIPQGFKAKVGNKITMDKDNLLTLSWDRRSGISHYRIDRRSDRNQIWKTVNSRVESNSISYTDLVCERKYEFELYAYGNGSSYKSEKSNPAIVKIRADHCPPSLPKPTRTRPDCGTLYPVVPPKDKHKPTKIVEVTSNCV